MQSHVKMAVMAVSAHLVNQTREYVSIMLRTLSNFAYGTYIGPIYSSRSIGLESMKKRDWNKFESAVGAWRRLEL